MASLADKWEQEGIEKAVLEEKIQLASIFLASCTKTQEIAELTGLTTKEILSLKDVARDK